MQPSELGGLRVISSFEELIPIIFDRTVYRLQGAVEHLGDLRVVQTKTNHGSIVSLEED